MKKNTYNVQTIMSFVVCECGGEFREQLEGAKFIMSNPAQLEFQCSNCEKTRILSQDDWPNARAIVQDLRSTEGGL